MKEVAVTSGQTKMHRAQVHNRKLKKALPTDLHKWLTADADRTCQQLASELSPITPPPPKILDTLFIHLSPRRANEI